MFYKLNSTRVTLREYWWGTPNPLVILMWIVKWLRIRIPGSVDDPNVESLEPFRVSPTDWPEEVRTKFQRAHEEVKACGFHSPVCYWIHDAAQQTDIYQAVYRSAQGEAFARVHYRVWRFTKPAKEYFFATIVSRFSDGTYLVSTAGKPDMLAPPSCEVNRLVGASTDRLWESHQGKSQERQHRADLIAPAGDDGALVESIEAHHREVRDFHVERGVFEPMDADEQEAVMTAAKPADPEQADTSRNAAVLAEIAQLEKKSSSWVNALIILGVSVALFLGLGGMRWEWEFVLLLLPILFIHEMGHYLAMRLFRYRNVRMFFIPLFGAAVSGQHYNVPGWKKTIVSLAGPLPGIFLAAVVGIAALIVDSPLLVNAAMLTLILNGLNLLPILPLDGGWVVHSVLFSRHYVLDAGFRLVTVGALILVAALIGDWILLSFGVLMLMGLPVAFRLVRVVEALRSRGLAAATSDNQSIPPETASMVIDEVRESFPQALSNKNLAQVSVQAFEAINARPPGCLASLFFTGVHVGSFLFALVLAAVLVFAQRTDLGEFFWAAANAPQNSVEVEDIEVRSPAEPPDSLATEKTIVATLRKADRAEELFDELAEELPPQATLLRFGQSLLLTVPGEDDAAREQWYGRLERETVDLFVSSEESCGFVSLIAFAPDEETAVEIEETLRAYFAGGSSMHLIPPWHPDLHLTPEHERARRMYAKLSDVSESYVNPEVERITNQIEAAFRKGDEEGAQRLYEQLREVQERMEEERREALASEASDPVEIEVVRLYQERPVFDYEAELEMDGEEGEGDEPEEGAVEAGPVEGGAEAEGGENEEDEGDAADAAASDDGDSETIDAAGNQAAEEYQERYDAWSRRMGPLLGQLPLEDDGAAPAQRRFSAAGHATRIGLIIQFNTLFFDRLVDGPPALLRWLADQECAGMKYEFQMGY